MYTEWTWHFFTLICCKNCIVSLKSPKINEKEARVGPVFKKLIDTPSTQTSREKQVYQLLHAWLLPVAVVPMTACWRPDCCWLGWESMSNGDLKSDPKGDFCFGLFVIWFQCFAPPNRLKNFANYFHFCRLTTVGIFWAFSNVSILVWENQRTLT